MVEFAVNHDLQKRYKYKSYTNFVYNGLLTNVVSEFNLREEINSAGSQIELELATSFQDAGPELLTDLLVTDDGDFVVSTDLESIIVDTDISIPGIPALNDNIEVWEYNEYYPDGLLIFEGKVTKWKSDFKNNTTKVTLLSLGVQLDNYLVQIFPNDVLIENNTTNSEVIIYSEWKDPLDRINEVAQTFVPGVTSDINSVYLNLGNPGTQDVPCTVSIYAGTPTSPGALVASVTRNVPPQASNTRTLFQFSAAATLEASTTYYFSIRNNSFSIDATNTISVGIDTLAGFSDGQRYSMNDLTGWASNADDIGFQLATSSGGIGNAFNSYDPSDIVRELLDNFNALGGAVTYDDDLFSIEPTDTTVSYTFKFNTYLDAIKKCVELAPQDWWYFVDPAYSVVYFQSLGQHPDHTFVLGKHLDNLEIEYSLEDVVNTVYFSGGNDGSGFNLLINATNADSVDRYGTWLKTPTDNRVTDETTATLLAESMINQYKNPRFHTNITIPSSVYDTNSIKIGDIVSFANFNSLIDSLQLQVMAKETNPYAVNLTLAILPPTQSKRIEDIKRNLDKEQTRDNPNT